MPLAVSHNSIIKAFAASGAGRKFGKIIEKLINKASTLIQMSAGTHGPVPIKCGVCQGDPLSGLMYNFAFDTIIRAIHKLPRVTILIFADDGWLVG